MSSTSSSSLSKLLREGSREAHDLAEKNPLMLGLIRGEFQGLTYAGLLRYLQPVYSSLEASLYIHRRNPLFAKLKLSALLRSASLKEDLSYFENRLGKNIQLEAGASCFEYAARLEEHSRKAPELLVAHVYTRYLGDLSGGQMIARSVRKALALEGDAGTRFYVFDEISHTGIFKREFREWMDSIEMSEKMKAAVCDETKEAFRLNDQLALEVWENYRA